MEKYVIIVAGGKGLRMGGDIPKQFVPINGMPVLMRTIEAFYAYDPQINIILVLPHIRRIGKDSARNIISLFLISWLMAVRLVSIL